MMRIARTSTVSTKMPTTTSRAITNIWPTNSPGVSMMPSLLFGRTLRGDVDDTGRQHRGGSLDGDHGRRAAGHEVVGRGVVGNARRPRLAVGELGEAAGGGDVCGDARTHP